MNTTSSTPGVATPVSVATQPNVPAPAPVGSSQPPSAKAGKPRFGRKAAGAPASAAPTAKP